MKPAADRLVLVRPRFHMDVGWAVDFYTLQGRWLATSYHETKGEAKREAAKQRQRFRRDAARRAR